MLRRFAAVFGELFRLLLRSVVSKVTFALELEDDEEELFDSLESLRPRELLVGNAFDVTSSFSLVPVTRVQLLRTL